MANKTASKSKPKDLSSFIDLYIVIVVACLTTTSHLLFRFFNSRLACMRWESGGNGGTLPCRGSTAVNGLLPKMENTFGCKMSLLYSISGTPVALQKPFLLEMSLLAKNG